jgi:DNA-binding beta-propeller fold protein YncE
MRWGSLFCAVLLACLSTRAGAQNYPYVATIPVPVLAGKTAAAEPQGIAFDTNNKRLLIAEGSNQVVQVLDGTSFALLATIGIAGVSGADGGHFSYPGGVAYDPKRNHIVVADTGNDRVQIIDGTTFGAVGTIGVAGVPGADPTHLSGPVAVAVDSANDRIAVADTGNSRVEIFDAGSLALVGTLGVSAAPGADNLHLSAPQGVAIDTESGHLLVGDTGNARIQVFDARSAAYLATIGSVGSVGGIGVDVFGRRILAADPGDFVVDVIDADALAPIGAVGLQDGFGVDNARFLSPSGLASDPATGRLFAGDSVLNRVQVFGPPSLLIAAVAPAGRAVAVGQATSIFATILNIGVVPLPNCQVALPNNAPPGLSVSFQTTDPTTNHATGQPNQPVTIAAGAGQSFVLSLSAATPLTAIGQSFLFTCDGTSPAPIFAGINTADLTFSATPTADIVAAAATPGGSGVVTVSKSSGPFTAFSVAALNLAATAPLVVSADSGSFLPMPDGSMAPGFYQTLPLQVLVCQTDPLSGQCLASPTAALSVTFPRGATATFNVFLASTGTAIANSLAEPRLFLRFTQATGGAVPVSVGEASVAVVTAANTNSQTVSPK